MPLWIVALAVDMTVLRCRILHLNGFTNADLINYRYQIHANVVTALHQLLEACSKFRIVHENVIQVTYIRTYLRNVELHRRLNATNVPLLRATGIYRVT